MKSVVVNEKLVYRAVNWIWVFVVHVWPQQHRPLYDQPSIHMAIHCRRWHHRAPVAIIMHRRRTTRRKSLHRWRQPVSFNFSCIYILDHHLPDTTLFRFHYFHFHYTCVRVCPSIKTNSHIRNVHAFSNSSVGKCEFHCSFSSPNSAVTRRRSSLVSASLTIWRNHFN